MLTSSVTAWSIPALNLKEELLHQEDFSDKPYTILNPENVFREAKELTELLKIYPNMRASDIVKLVAFKPERAVLHALMVAINRRLKVSDELQFQGLVHNLYEQFKLSDNYHKAVKRAYLKRENLALLITALLEKREDFASKNNKYGFDLEKIATKIANLNPLVRDVSFGQYLENYDEKKAIVALTLDELYREWILPTSIDCKVDQLIDEIIKKEPTLGITEPLPENRQTIMIAGGQASGKSGALAVLKEQMEKDDNLENFVSINADNYKPIILKAGSIPNPYLYSQLAQHEANHIRIKLQRQIESQIREHQAPNLYVDQVFLGPKKVNFSLDGRGVIALIVSTDVENAMERSFRRGLQAENHQGRFEHTKGVLAGHYGVAEHFLKDIIGFKGKKMLISILDNNVAINEAPVEVMRLDLHDTPPKAIIYDAEKLKAFFKKMTIRLNAHNKEELYPVDSLAKTEKIYQQFIDQLVENKFVILSKPKSAIASIANNSLLATCKSYEDKTLKVPTEEIKQVLQH